VTTWAPTEILDLDVLDAERLLVSRVDGDSVFGGWSVSTLSLGSGTESNILTTDELFPSKQGVTTDGTCLFLSYQRSFDSGRESRGDIGWVRIDAVP